MHERFAVANLPAGTLTNDKYTGEIAEITDTDGNNALLTFHDGFAEWFPLSYTKEIDTCTKCQKRPADIDDFGVTLCNKCFEEDDEARRYLLRQEREFNFRHYGNENGPD